MLFSTNSINKTPADRATGVALLLSSKKKTVGEMPDYNMYLYNHARTYFSKNL